MDVTLKFLVVLTAAINCNGVSLRQQLAHITRRQHENAGNGLKNTGRRFNMPKEGVIIGAPSYPSHLPEAEPILPGHTLLHPALGMLKSAVKFPHRDLENGAGVYGNIDNLGIRYDGKNERLMYSGFRRMPTDIVMIIPESSEMAKLDLSTEKEDTLLRKLYRNSNSIIPEKMRNKNVNNKIKRIITIYPAVPRNIQHRPPFMKPGNLNLSKFIPYGKHKIEKRSPNEEEYLEEMDGEKLESRLHTSAVTLTYVQNILSKMRQNKQRRQNQNLYLKIPKEMAAETVIIAANKNPNLKVEGASKGYGLSEDSNNEEEAIKEALDKMQKYAWFWKAKDTFNHIKINSDAPDMEEYFPKDSEEDNLKSWSYYHLGGKDFRSGEIDD